MEPPDSSSTVSIQVIRPCAIPDCLASSAFWDTTDARRSVTFCSPEEDALPPDCAVVPDPQAASDVLSAVRATTDVNKKQ
ncbi:MAG: hypothetical protein LKE91_03840 [Lachnospiraceae bacterium]|jgi:hypothetical protein|nr:hypothetical protein [Lachnospiraceae bacterium]